MPVAERDFLDEDVEIRGQKYVCMSFLSPESVLLKKDIFYFSKFLSGIGRDVTALFDNLTSRFEGSEDGEVQDMIRSLRDRYDFLNSDAALQTQYDTFLSLNPQLQAEFDAENDFQTSVRGIKVRGSYETFAEAENRVKQIQKFDKKFHVYIGSVGCWCPWDPSPDSVGQQEYGETHLNTLMKQYNENIQQRDEMHEVRRKLFSEPNPAPAVEIEDVTPEEPVVVQEAEAEAEAEATPAQQQEEDEDELESPFESASDATEEITPA